MRRLLRTLRQGVGVGSMDLQHPLSLRMQRYSAESERASASADKSARSLASPKLVAVGAGRGDVADEWSRPYVLPARLDRGVDILHDPVFNKVRLALALSLTVGFFAGPPARPWTRQRLP